MSFLTWLAVVGVLFLVMALSPMVLQRLPVSTSLIYLACGIVIGPLGFFWLEINPIGPSRWFERLTEITVIVSLFVGGLKLRLPLSDPAWRAAFILTGPVMLLTIVGVALFANLALGLPVAFSLLLGAVLAPTDPVLAGSVKVSHAADDDRLRYGLSGEAGLNDGAAFPFVVLSLMWMEHGSFGGWVGTWAVHRLLWAVPAGLALGYLLGRLGGRLAILIRMRHAGERAPNDLLALAMIALTYAAAEVIGAWGFMAVFAAGVGLRSAERRVVSAHPHPSHPRSGESSESSEEHPPAENMVQAIEQEGEMKHPAVAAGVVVNDVTVFGETLERLLEILVVGLVGIMVGAWWDWRAVPLALALVFVIRPISTLLLLTASPTSMSQRWMMGWFGIRGIGSLFYVSYALSHGVAGEAAKTALGLTISVVAISILLHGATGQLLLARYEATLREE